MAIYLITYDLKEPAYEQELLSYVRSAGYAMVTKSSYVVIGNKTADQIVSDIRQIANDNIYVYVFTVSNPYSGFGDTSVNNWLANNVP